MLLEKIRIPYIVVGFLFLIILLALFVDKEAKQESLVEWPPHRLEMTQCVNSLRELMGKSSTNEKIEDVWDQLEACQYQLKTQGTLDEHQLRRSKFYQQNYSDTVVLWMVVFITISGIILAGMQLLISYRLAVAAGTNLGDTGGEISLEKGKVSLKSSLSGIFILAISFAFFWLFVMEVYNIKIVDPDRGVKNSQASAPSETDDKKKPEEQTKNQTLKQGNFGIEPSDVPQQSPSLDAK